MGQRNTREIRKYLELSDFENSTKQNLCKEVKTVLGDKFTGKF